jgi:TetR/AcrR family transcriptional repressor of nem operon
MSIIPNGATQLRYPDSHKEETRAKVVKAAAAAVRARGPDGVSVAEIMKEAGLTHGGFYAHFPSKEALVAAAVGEAFDQGRRRFGRLTADLTGPDALGAFVDSYVSMEHRAAPERGCPVATIASDLPRQGPAVRAAFDAGVTSLIGRVANWLPADVADREGLAGSLVAEMAGVVSLSRAVSDDAMAARFLEQSRRRIRVRAGLDEDAMETT